MNPSTRGELATLFVGEGIELGVAAGYFSSSIVRSPLVSRLWSVDRWGDHHNLKEYKSASERLAKFGQGRCIPLRMTFEEATSLFEDNSLDFIYIDGYAHTGQEGGKTLSEWWPKLKVGGYFSGHDYHSQFPLTIEAVNEFSDEVGVPVNLTQEARYPSWWMIKI